HKGRSDRIVKVYDDGKYKLAPPLHHKGRWDPTDNSFPSVRRVAFAPDGRTVVTGTAAGHVRCWPAPPKPLKGSAERLALWVAWLADRDLAAAGGVGWLKPEQWQARQRRLAARGGPPVPPEDVLAWPRREAEACLRDRWWFSACWHLDRLIA